MLAIYKLQNIDLRLILNEICLFAKNKIPNFKVCNTRYIGTSSIYNVLNISTPVGEITFMKGECNLQQR